MITRTFTTTFAPNYIANTIIEVIHFRNMVFATDEMVAIYLDTANASMNLGSFNMAKFPEFEGDESDTEKVLLLNKSESQSNKIGLKILKRKNNIGAWNEAAEIILVNRGRKDYLDLRSYTGYPTRIMEKNDAIAIQLVDYGDGLLWDTDFISIDFGCTVEIKKKDDLTALTNRLQALENLLGIMGAPTTTLPGRNGLVPAAGINQGSRLLRGDSTWQDSSEFVNVSAAQTITGSKSFSSALLPTNVGLGAPTFTSRSVGSKYVFWNQFSASGCDYAMGMQAASMWFGLPNNIAGNFFQWFGGVTPIATLFGNGDFIIAGFLNIGNVAIKTKLLTGTTASTQGAVVSIPHGLVGDKIIGVQVLVRPSTNSGIGNLVTGYVGYQYEWYYDGANVIIMNISTNSSYILSKPINILITYIA